MYTLSKIRKHNVCGTEFWEFGGGETVGGQEVIRGRIFFPIKHTLNLLSLAPFKKYSSKTIKLFLVKHNSNLCKRRRRLLKTEAERKGK